MSRLSISPGCLVSVFIISIASACPTPPPTAATTFQKWTFDTLTNPYHTLPEFYCNKYGTPMAELSTTQNPPDYFNWWNVAYDRQGVWAGEPLKIILTIPNQPILSEYKEIWLEMGFRATLDGIDVLPGYAGGDGGDGVIEEISRSIVEGPNGWKQLDIRWRIEPNPNKEKICIGLTGTGGLVDYITVRTVCIPEPATVTLLGLSALVLLTRKRK